MRLCKFITFVKLQCDSHDQFPSVTYVTNTLEILAFHSSQMNQLVVSSYVIFAKILVTTGAAHTEYQFKAHFIKQVL